MLFTFDGAPNDVTKGTMEQLIIAKNIIVEFLLIVEFLEDGDLVCCFILGFICWNANLGLIVLRIIIIML